MIQWGGLLQGAWVYFTRCILLVLPEHLGPLSLPWMQQLAVIPDKSRLPDTLRDCRRLPKFVPLPSQAEHTISHLNFPCRYRILFTHPPALPTVPTHDLISKCSRDDNLREPPQTTQGTSAGANTESDLSVLHRGMQHGEGRPRMDHVPGTDS